MSDPLTDAIVDGDVESVRRILDERAEAPSAIFLVVAVQHYRTAIVKLLLDAGADVDDRSVHGMSPLHLATLLDREREEAYDIVDQLLVAGADPALVEERGPSRAPLDSAARRASPKTLRRMLSDPRSRARLDQALEAAASSLERVEVLLEHGANPDSGHALAEAAGRKKLEVVRRLLDHGASADRVDRRGCTPLHRATEACQPAIVELLVQRGARSDRATRSSVPDTMIRKGETPRNLAERIVRENWELAVEYIIRAVQGKGSRKDLARCWPEHASDAWSAARRVLEAAGDTFALECLSDTELREEVASNSDVVYYTQQLRDAVHVGELVGALIGAPKPAQLGPGDWTVVESDCDAEDADEDPVAGGRLVIRSDGSFRGRLGGLELSGTWAVPEGEPIVLVDDELGPLFATFERDELSIGLELGDAPVRYQLRPASP